MIHSKYEKENITFLGFAFFSSLWTFNNFYLRINTDVTVLRVSYGLGIIVATAGLVWVYFFLKKKLPTFVKIVVFPLSVLLFFVAIDSNLIINSLYSITFFGYTGELGNLFYLYSCYFAFVGVNEQFKPTPMQKVVPATPEEEKKFEDGEKFFLYKI